MMSLSRYFLLVHSMGILCFFLSNFSLNDGNFIVYKYQLVNLMLIYLIFILCFLFGQWKFSFFSLGRPEYLQDSDIVSSRFQVHSFILGFLFFFVCDNSIDIQHHFHMSEFMLALYLVIEERCLWCLGAVSWLGAY